jgi:hypothetical protein
MMVSIQADEVCFFSSLGDVIVMVTFLVGVWIPCLEVYWRLYCSFTLHQEGMEHYAERIHAKHNSDHEGRLAYYQDGNQGPEVI